MAGKTTHLVPNIVELGHQANNATIGIKTKELITIKIDRVVENLHLDCARSIAIDDTTRDLVDIVSNLVLHLYSPPFLFEIIVCIRFLILQTQYMNIGMIASKKIKKLIFSSFVYAYISIFMCVCVCVFLR